MEKDKNTKLNPGLEEKITRNQALKKAGVTALTAASLFFLETKPAAAQSNPGAGTTDSPSRTPSRGRDNDE